MQESAPPSARQSRVSALPQRSLSVTQAPPKSIAESTERRRNTRQSSPLGWVGECLELFPLRIVRWKHPGGVWMDGGTSRRISNGSRSAVFFGELTFAELSRELNID